MTEKKPTPDGTPFPQLFVEDEIDLSRPRDIKPETEPPFVTVERDYPRVANAIEMTWGHRELDAYLQKLIVPDRGDREGFPKPVLAALLKLYQQHSAQFSFPPMPTAWTQSPKGKSVHELGFPRIEDAWGDDPMAKHTYREGKRGRDRD